METAWQNLVEAGGHPEADHLQPKIEGLIRRQQAWAAVCSVSAAITAENDAQLTAAWNESLFANWNEADRERPRLDAAKQRLELLRQLRERIAEPISFDREKAINRIARDLPADYFPEAQPHWKQAQLRLGVVQLLSDAFHRPQSDLGIYGAWVKLGELAGAGDDSAEIPAAHRRGRTALFAADVAEEDSAQLPGEPVAATGRQAAGGLE